MLGTTGVIIVSDRDGARAARRAVEHAEATGERVAVWVGDEDEPELAEMRAELSPPAR